MAGTGLDVLSERPCNSRIHKPFRLERRSLDCERPAGENRWITGQSAVHGGAVSHKAGRRGLTEPTRTATADGSVNRVIHRFSPGGQGALCLVKFFAIMGLLEAFGFLSTARGLAFEEEDG